MSQETEQTKVATTKLPRPTPLDNAAWERLLMELVKYYRLSAIGRRTNGIIHNLNTPLQAVIMQIELVNRKLAEEAKFATRLPAELAAEWQKFQHYREQKNQQLQEQVAKIQRLVEWIRYQGFHEMSQGTQEIDLNQLVEQELAGYETEAFFKHRVSKNICLDPKLLPIRGFYIDFSQSFRNLVDNALEALQEVAEPVLTVNTQQEGHCRQIIIIDNGPGIPEAVQAQLFQPFCTTKNQGAQPHVGLGLFLAQRLLSPYGGRIEIASRPGATCCRLILP